MTTLEWGAPPEAWDYLKRCARKHCPHRHLKINWDDCPCAMHTYMRTQAGLDALAKANRNRAVYVANEWRSGGVPTERRD